MLGEWPSWLRIAVTVDSERPVCSCGGTVHCHGAREVVLVDLPCFGRATVQVGPHGRAVSDIARDLGCGWHAVMDAVVAVGE